jgi:hypothetical protein
VRFIEPDHVSSWRLAVDVEEGTVDLMFGNHHTDTIGVVFDYQEDVSLGLATEFVAMSVGLVSEDEWRVGLPRFDGRGWWLVRLRPAELM